MPLSREQVLAILVDAETDGPNLEAAADAIAAAAAPDRSRFATRADTFDAALQDRMFRELSSLLAEGSFEPSLGYISIRTNEALGALVRVAGYLVGHSEAGKTPREVRKLSEEIARQFRDAVKESRQVLAASEEMARQWAVARPADRADRAGREGVRR